MKDKSIKELALELIVETTAKENGHTNLLNVK